VYNLPIHLRIFYTKKLIEIKEKEQEYIESKGSSSPNSSKIAKPGINPK
jgi:hypothetical protein